MSFKIFPTFLLFSITKTNIFPFFPKKPYLVPFTKLNIPFLPWRKFTIQPKSIFERKFVRNTTNRTQNPTFNDVCLPTEISSFHDPPREDHSSPSGRKTDAEGTSGLPGGENPMSWLSKKYERTLWAKVQ